MNIKNQVKLATFVALSSTVPGSDGGVFIKQAQAAKIEQKDINISGLFSKISNLELVAFDKRAPNSGDYDVSLETSKQPENIEMLQLSGARSDSVKNFSSQSLNGDEVNDAMVESFKKEKDSAPEQTSSSEDTAAKKDQKEDDNPEEMTISEHMAHVKKQTSQAL